MTINFLPWIGEGYSTGIADQRILILGESHYHKCKDAPECRYADRESEAEVRHRNMTRGVVGWWRDNPHRSPLSYRIPALFGKSKREFWSHVAFYNYLQTFAGPRARVRPNEDQWDDDNSALAFQDVLDQLQPSRVLVLGKKLWEHLPGSPKLLFREPERERELGVANDLGGKIDVNTSAYWYFASSNKAALLMPIMHPAAPRFVIDEWTEIIPRWLAFRTFPAS